jgi:tripartite motif-containing protein 71
MNAKKVLIVLSMLGLFSGSIAASEKYNLVKVWPEAPQGWHFYELFGIAVDKSGNVYVGDSGNYRIKKFDSEGRFIAQWGSPGEGDGQFSSIHGLKVGSSGTVYVVDEDNRTDITTSRIQKFTPYGQFIGLFERKSPGADKLKLIVSMTEDDRGNVFVLAEDFVLDEYRTRRAAIEKYSPDGKFATQWEMGVGSGDGEVQSPEAMAIDAKGNIYVADGSNHRVQKFDPSGKFLLKWGTQGDGKGLFSHPNSIGIDKSGDVYVFDGYYSFQRFTSEGEFLARWKVPDHDPRGIALDSHSNVHVAYMDSHTVVTFDPNGNLISEWGSAGTGDGRFAEPGSIAVDPSGHIVVADVGNARLQRFDSEGRFVSKWGSQIWPEVWDLATDASGNLYAACGDANEVQKFDSEGRLIGRWGSSGSGDGQFRYASAITVGPSGHVYVADARNNRVQKFTSDGKFLVKWGTKGTGDGQFDEPVFIAADRSGNVWVGDQLSNETHRMQKFDADGKFLAAWTRRIMRPLATNYRGVVAVDFAGNSYYAFESRIEKYDVEGNLISAYGREEFTSDELGQAWAVCVDQAGCLYVTAPANPNPRNPNVLASGSIRKFDANGKFITKWMAEGMEGKKRFPNGRITVDRAGNIYALCWGSTSIRRLSSDGRLVAEFQIAVPREDRFSELGGMAVDSSGRVYAVDSVDVDWDWGIPSIKQFDSNGQIVTTWDVLKIAEGKIKYPVRIAVDGSGNMYVTDQSSHCVHKLDAQGKYIKSWGDKGTGDGQFDTPEGIAVDKSGNVLVCDRQNSRIQKFDSDGKFLTKWGKEGSGEGEFHFPAAAAVDKDGNVFVADSDNHRIQKFTAEGKFLTEWGQFGEAPGQFNVPLGIAVDDNGNVYVSDSHNHRIQKFAPVR